MFIIDHLEDVEKRIKKKTEVITYLPEITTASMLVYFYFFLAFLLAFISQLFTECLLSVRPNNSCWEYYGVRGKISLTPVLSMLIVFRRIQTNEMKVKEEPKVLLKPAVGGLTWFDGSQQMLLIFLEYGRSFARFPYYYRHMFSLVLSHI